MRKIVAIAAMMLLTMVAAQAANNYTRAGTQIDNNATLSYTVGSVQQTIPVYSNTDSFVVDRKIDFVVTNDDQNNKIDVQPGAQDQVLHFTLRNDGNDDENFTISYQDITTDQFNPQNCQVSINGSGYQNFTQTVTLLAPDANVTIDVQCDIPQGEADDNNGTIALIATIDGRTNDTGSDVQGGTAQNVFADAAGTASGDGDKDGKHSANGTYHVVTATLDLTKLSCVISDGVTSNNANAKRIPGATIAYVFDVNNTGSADATSVTIADDLAAELDETQITVQALEANTNAACTCANGTGNSTTGTNSTPTNSQTNHDVEINIGTVNSGKHSCLEIRVPIK